MPIEKKCAEAIIDRPAEEIWAVIGNFCEIAWIPGSEEATATREGDLRTVRRKAWEKIGFSVKQRLIDHSDERRTYSYVLLEPVSFESMMGPGKIAHAIDGTLTVTPIDADRSRVTWEIETEDFLIGGAYAEYQLALDTVKARLESD
jgi:hypothetical protein